MELDLWPIKKRAESMTNQSDIEATTVGWRQSRNFARDQLARVL